MERILERIMEQTVELARSSGEAWSSGPGVNDTTSAAATAAGKSVGEPRPPGRHSASTGSVFAVSAGEAGSVGPNDTTSVAATAVAMSVEEARLPGIAKCSATAATAVATTVAETVDEA